MAKKKGRSQRLIELRNRKLIKRYYYWTDVKRRRFDDVLQILSEEEFFIEQQTIQLILRENNDQLNQLIASKNPQQLTIFDNEAEEK